MTPPHDAPRAAGAGQQIHDPQRDHDDEHVRERRFQAQQDLGLVPDGLQLGHHGDDDRAGGPAQDTAQQQPMQPRALQNPDEEGRRRERGHRERGHGKHQCGGRFLGNLGNLHVEAAVKQDDQERESPEIRGKSFDVGARGQLQDRPQENT